MCALFIAMARSQVVVTHTPPESSVAPIPVVQTAVPVSFSLPLSVTLAWIITVATGLGGVAVIWRFVAKASALVNSFNVYGPVLVEIAKEFKSDSGSTLRDSINRIEASVAEAKRSAAEAKATATLAEKMTEQLTELVIRIPKDR
jgi:hypothetical protein